jgi:hypothetical protein
MGTIFAIIVCTMFHIIFNPPTWATVSLFTDLFVKYTLEYSLSDKIEELINYR